MRLGVFFPTRELAPLDEMVARFQEVADRGLASVWLPQVAGRPAPRVVFARPAIVTGDEADGRAKADEQLVGYGNIPVYRAVLDREGVAEPYVLASQKVAVSCSTTSYDAKTERTSPP